jgi:hypothetical protein|tara:strand:- start:454 stop:600 length:147 start_codon:yes stop_codon:yes gene_type:complete
VRWELFQDWVIPTTTCEELGGNSKAQAGMGKARRRLKLAAMTRNMEAM